MIREKLMNFNFFIEQSALYVVLIRFQTRYVARFLTVLSEDEADTTKKLK